MASPQIQEAEVNDLLSSGRLSVTGKHDWKQSNEKSWFKSTVNVSIAPPISTKSLPGLKIVISVSFFDKSKYSFTLVWNNNSRVRALCVNGSHTNKHTDKGKWTRRMHKHRWSDKCHERFAYSPTDISATEIQGQFVQFCKECGIACSATLAPIPPAQGNLYDDL